MTTLTCEHGDPHPTRCALCRRREQRLQNPSNYAPTTRAEPVRGVPRPPWFDAEVEVARERARKERKR